MNDKTWEIEYGGRRIRVINRVSIFPPRTSEALEVDGEAVAENSGSFLRRSSVLRAEVDFQGVMTNVEACIAQKVGSLNAGCHILVDGELVGGDVTSKLAVPDREAAKRKYERGPLRQILTTGMFAYGLPFAVLMTVFHRAESVPATALAFVIELVGFGGAMGWFTWRMAKSRYENDAR